MAKKTSKRPKQLKPLVNNLRSAIDALDRDKPQVARRKLQKILSVCEPICFAARIVPETAAPRTKKKTGRGK